MAAWQSVARDMVCNHFSKRFLSFSHIFYVSLNPCRLQGCIAGIGKLVEDAEKTSSLIPVYSVVLVGGGVHQQRDFATWLLLGSAAPRGA